jgi:hypothetical protein
MKDKNMAVLGIGTAQALGFLTYLIYNLKGIFMEIISLND